MISTNYNRQTSFQGNLIIKNSLKNETIKKHLLNLDSVSLKNMLKGHDVIVRSKTRYSKYADLRHFKGQELYKIVFSQVKEGSKIDKLLDILHFKPRKTLTYHYHSEDGILNRLNEERMQHIWRKLG